MFLEKALYKYTNEWLNLHTSTHRALAFFTGFAWETKRMSQISSGHFLYLMSLVLDLFRFLTILVTPCCSIFNAEVELKFETENR